MSTEPKRLTRSSQDKMLGGVCGGIGAYFGVDPTLIRLGFALLAVLGLGSPVLLYLLLWIIVPLDTTAGAAVGMTPPASPAPSEPPVTPAPLETDRPSEPPVV